MKSLSSTLNQVCRQSTCRRRWMPAVVYPRGGARYMSRSAEEYAEALAAAEKVENKAETTMTKKTAAEREQDLSKKLTFEDLGLHPPIVASLRAAFPNVHYPTPVQATFIPAILGGKDVLLKDQTGSGKSFGLILALLNKTRLVSKKKGSTKDWQRQRHITSLVLVPHRDLAYQLFHWVEQMVNAGGGADSSVSAADLASVVQVLVRDNDAHLSAATLSQLRANPPHVLIGTPQAVMDVLQKDEDVLQLSTLSSVCVDEVDYLVETLGRKDVERSFKRGVEKQRRKMERHPGVTRVLLDAVFALRREVNERRRDESGMEVAKRRAGAGDAANEMPPSPQLILSSATLRTHLRNYVYDESGWLDKDRVVKVSGSEKEGGVLHSVLLVSDRRVWNIPGAVPSPATFSVDEEGQDGLERSDGEGEAGGSEIGPELIEKYRRTASPLNASMLETIATVFAVDVPSLALLVLPSSAPVTRAVWELRQLGVNAEGLDLERMREEGSGEARLLVATLATTRGVDLPGLSHVFIYGVPEGGQVNGRSVDAYVHISGRVGRFGRRGRVVTVVEGKEKEKEEEEEGGKKMGRILAAIETRPVRLEGFS